MLLRERKGRADMVKHQFLWYPSVGNVSAEPTELMKQLSKGYFLDLKLKQWLLGHYLSESDDPVNPFIQPIHCKNFNGMPPITVISPGYDPGTEGHEAYCNMHKEANVEAEFFCAPTTIHAFLMFLGKIPAAMRAAEMSADLIRSKLILA
jgi:acetyl esterase/lipase